MYVCDSQAQIAYDRLARSFDGDLMINNTLSELRYHQNN